MAANITYSSASNTSSITLPFHMTAEERKRVRLVIRTTDAQHVRGKVFVPHAVFATTFQVTGDVRASKFYVGFIVPAQREESTFYIRTATGHIPTERLTVKNFWVDYAKTGYSRINVTNSQTGNEVNQELGWAQPVTLGAEPQLQKGSLRAVVDGDALDVTITLINDSPFPSQWTATNYEFESVQRATPMLTPYGGPVQ